MTNAKWALAGLGVLAAAGAASWSMPALAQNNYAYIGTSLFGHNEPDGGADEDASGDFSAELDLTNGRMCYFLEVQDLDGFTAAHIHEGRKGANGPPVVTLELVGEDGDEICTDVDAELLKKIARRSGNYYVNVHTEKFPKGAIRGQLDES